MINVVIPTYRPGDYLLDCLRSLEQQTLCRKKYRVVIVLNGDKCPYFDTINGWINSLKCNSELIYSSEKGVSNARNLALDRYTDGYVAFIDDDDYVSPDYLTELLKCLSVSAADAIACSDVRTIAPDGAIGKDYISQAYSSAKKRHNESNLFANRSFLSSSCCKLIPRSIIGDCRFDSCIKVGEDSLFMYAISYRINTVLIADRNCIYYRRLRNNSATRSKRRWYNEVVRKVYLIGKYTKIYIENILKNNIALYLSRIIATIIN